MIVRCLGGFSLKDPSGTIVATLQYLPSPTEYPSPVVEVRVQKDGVGIVVTDADEGLNDTHDNIDVFQGVDYFPFS